VNSALGNFDDDVDVQYFADDEFSYYDETNKLADVSAPTSARRDNATKKKKSRF